MKIVLNILRGVVAFVLSLVLFGTLVGSVVGYSATTFIEEDVVTGIFTTIDYAEVFQPGSDSYVELNEAGLDPVLIGELLNTEAMDELFALYFEDLFTVLDENGIQSTFTNENIEQVLDKHIEELMPIVNDLLQLPDGVDETLLKQYTYEFMQSIVDAMPNAESMGLRGPNMTEEDLETLTVLRMLDSGMFMIPFIVVIILVSGLVLLCRYEKFEGFVWLTVVYLLAGGLTYSIGNALRSDSLPVTSTQDEFEAMLMPVIEVFGEKLVSCALILFGVAIVCLLVFIVGRMLKNKKVNNELVVE